MKKNLSDKALSVVAEMEQVEQAKLQRDADIAKKVHARLLSERKESPDGFLVGAAWGEDDTLKLIKRHVPEALPKPDKDGRVHDLSKGVDGWNRGAKKFVIFDSEDKHKKHINEGYIPVIHEGEHVRNGGGDLMYWTDIRFKRDRMRSSIAMSDNLLKRPDEDMQDAAKAGGGETLSRELTITQGAPN